MITILEDEVYDAKFFTRLPCAICDRFFPPKELMDGLCPGCLKDEEAAYEDLLEEEPF